MSKTSEMLSAYLDNELSQDQRLELEAQLQNSPELSAELDQLAAADKMIADQFDELNELPIPVGLEAQILAAELAKPDLVPANSNVRWQSLAAAFAMFVIGGLGGYMLNEQTTPEVQMVSAESWLTHVAGYHGIYAKQKRHLVEVPASESAHITTWLSNTTGVNFTIPELENAGFEFQGARLLAAKGQPIAQLIYKDSDGSVIAICLKKGADVSGNTSADFALASLNDFNIVSWSKNAADYLVIGDIDETTLKQVAQSVELNI